MSRSPVLAAVLACVLAIPAAVSAQAWNAFTPNNTGEYWDNGSNDGLHCNIGWVVTGQAGTAANPCANQMPAGWLPYTGAAMPFNFQGAPNIFHGFLFSAGTYTFRQGVGIGGDDGVSPYTWGYFTSKDAVGRVIVPNGVTFSLTNTFASSWGIWDIAGGDFRYSDIDPLFALFATAPTSVGGGGFLLSPGIGATFVVGMEAGGSDNDFNDVTVSFSRVADPTSTVPEPSTFMLLGTGLLGICAAARRRRSRS